MDKHFSVTSPTFLGLEKQNSVDQIDSHRKQEYLTNKEEYFTNEQQMFIHEY